MNCDNLVNSIPLEMEEIRKLIQKYLKQSYKGNETERENAKYILKCDREVLDIFYNLSHKSDVYKLLKL